MLKLIFLEQSSKFTVFESLVQLSLASIAVSVFLVFLLALHWLGQMIILTIILILTHQSSLIPNINFFLTSNEIVTKDR